MVERAEHVSKVVLPDGWEGCTWSGIADAHVSRAVLKDGREGCTLSTVVLPDGRAAHVTRKHASRSQALLILFSL